MQCYICKKKKDFVSVELGFGSRHDGAQICEYCVTDIDKMIDALLIAYSKPKRSKWHRVEDELPSKGKCVIVRDTDGEVIARYVTHPDELHTQITHWRELPKFKKPINEIDIDDQLKKGEG